MTFCHGAAVPRETFHVEFIGEEARHAAALDEVDATLAGRYRRQVASASHQAGRRVLDPENENSWLMPASCNFFMRCSLPRDWGFNLNQAPCMGRKADPPLGNRDKVRFCKGRTVLRRCGSGGVGDDLRRKD